ncbi:hypothetical protein [Jannaschia formosa]|uniref:hypothetical protein n=1 Tax=Jannaschia formosa TaxID=2259592 RepID=UPI000E1BDA71|nr:hypothetical protein [Jannaschia formosa]TFL16840.1 hypothetical protein DR046_17690 [Jannaschia formosa]
MGHQGYATPLDDIAAWRGAAPAPGTLPPHLRAFLQSGAHPILGTRGADGRPLVGSGTAARVEADGTVRVLAQRLGNGPLLEALAAGAAIAATFSHPRDHRSIQLKARAVTVTPARPDDATEAARQVAVLTDYLLRLGYEPAQARGISAFDADDLVSVEFLPEQVFTQTPGPGAGTELRAEPAA